MMRRAAWLCASLASMLMYGAWVTLPTSSLALRTAELLPADAVVTAAAQGRGALLQALLIAELRAALPWMMLGASLACALRMLLWCWQREPAPPSRVDALGSRGPSEALHAPAVAARTGEQQRDERTSKVRIDEEADIAKIREADVAALAAALRTLPEQLGHWNVNGRLQAAAPADGWWLPDQAVVLLPATRIRRWLLQRLPAALAERLQLAQATTATHTAAASIGVALRAAELLPNDVPGQPAQSAWRFAALGPDRPPVVVAVVRGDLVPAVLRSRWGTPKPCPRVQVP